MAFDYGRGGWFTPVLGVLLLTTLLAARAESPAATPTETLPANWLTPSPGSAAPPSSPLLRQQWLQQVRQLAVRHLTLALEHAYRAHIEQARPLPAEVVDFLTPLFPAELLERARYVVNGDELTLPSILNQTHKALFGQDHAVSVDHLIVFSRDPGLARASDAHWWAHELAHHLQYRRLGSIAAFAEEYVGAPHALEQEAEVWGQAGARKYIDERVLEQPWQRPSDLGRVDFTHEDIPERQE